MGELLLGILQEIGDKMRLTQEKTHMRLVKFTWCGGYSFGKPYMQLTYDGGEVELLPFHTSVSIQRNGTNKVLYAEEVLTGDTIVEVLN
jgi:hypothetical protein